MAIANCGSDSEGLTLLEKVLNAGSAQHGRNRSYPFPMRRWYTQLSYSLLVQNSLARPSYQQHFKALSGAN